MLQHSLIANNISTNKVNEKYIQHIPLGNLTVAHLVNELSVMQPVNCYRFSQWSNAGTYPESDDCILHTLIWHIVVSL
jgi:hypothetical protein